MTPLPGEQRTNPLNVLRFLMSRPGAASVLLHKIVKRVRDGAGRYSDNENEAWISANAQRSEDIAKMLDPKLWEEATIFGTRVRERAAPILAAVPFDMGAGGDYEFLYWLTRFTTPAIVVETGVSAGWTSQAFLAAIDRNGSGELYSSDFPYFRVKDPEKYIGLVVEPQLKDRWHLSTEGDEKALPAILSAVGKVDLFHYDSDKSYSGRAFAVAAVRECLSPDGIILVDDILNDSWFREFAERETIPFAVLNGRCGLIDPSRRLLKH
jgi:predicted O-methyltransferase YrrM